MRHRLCRIPKGEVATDVERLATNGRWVPDDGKPGLAFIGRGSTGTPLAWYLPCKCRPLTCECPADRALHRACERWHCANGRDAIPVRQKAKKES